VVNCRGVPGGDKRTRATVGLDLDNRPRRGPHRWMEAERPAGNVAN
jgi:hypothetical protein